MGTGGCLCGKVRYEITAEPLALYYCHCPSCRRASGSSFATNVRVRASDFRITSGKDSLGEFESSPGKFRCFCRRCGSPIYNKIPGDGDHVPVRAGTLDEDPKLRPSGHIYAGMKSPWFEICDGLPAFSAGPDSDRLG